MSKSLIAIILFCLILVLRNVLMHFFYPSNSSREVSDLSHIKPLSKGSVTKKPVEPSAMTIQVSNPDRIVTDVKRIIVAYKPPNYFNIESTEFQEFHSQFKINSRLELPASFKSWQTASYVFEDLCDYGYQLLQLYEQKNRKDEIYEAIAVALIEIIGDALKDYKVGDTKVLHFSENLTSIFHLLKFLIAYEYIGTNENIKHLICHSLLIKFVPTLTKVVGNNVSPDYPLALSIAMIRLLTNYLYDKVSYNNDVNKINKLKSISSLHILINNSDVIKSGLYRDGSCIEDPNIASYDYLLFYRYPDHEFYENICKVIGVKVGNLPTIVKTVFRKILHPQINYVPFGLFDKNGRIDQPYDLNIQGLTGVFIFPLIGLGVFKNHEMMFSVRVQRPEIALGMPNDPNFSHVILGSIQSRRIYQINRNYQIQLTSNELSKEPGVISVINEDGLPLYKDELKTENRSYSCSEVDKNNLIGRLPDDKNVMFWFNRYRCNLIRCTVIEAGLMTDNGLEIFLLISNEGSANVQLCVKDEAPNDFDRKLVCVSNKRSSGGLITFSPKRVDGVSWSMLFNRSLKSHLSYDNSQKIIRFNYAFHLYTIYLKENSQYVVEVDNNKNHVFGGSSSSNPDDTLTLDGYKPMRRNPQTLMYS